MPEMTPEQKQHWNVKFAEAMGWNIVHVGKPPVIWAVRDNERSDQPIDFWDNPADAIELADKLDILFKKCGRGFYEAHKASHGPVIKSDDLCTAICLAARAFLEET